jgi:hypothetical protein
MHFAAAAAFAVCTAATFISYKPYEFTWDDSDYLLRAIAVNRAFWSGDIHGLGSAMVSWHTPVMTLLALPWRHLESGAAPGDCFVALAMLIALLAALCLYLLLCIGVKPLFLAIASLCVVASLGPYQAGEHARHTHDLATRFLADNLFAWTALSATLLIPFEARIPCRSRRSAAMRGILCALILSLGALTKVSFLYFAALVLATLLFIRFRDGKGGIALMWLFAFACCIAPTTAYLVRYGRSAFAAGKAASFGGVANFYNIPLRQFLANTILESPGLLCSLVLLSAALLFLGIRRRSANSLQDWMPFVIMVGYGAIVLASANREIRFGFATIVALPLLVSILLSNQGDALPLPRAALAAGVAFLGLAVATLPMRSRSYQGSLASANAVLARAARCNAKSVLLATDSPSLNIFSMNLASELSSTKSAIQTLAYHAVAGIPIGDDFAAISNSDIVVFQDEAWLRPKFTNQRRVEYERYMQQTGATPIRVANDTNVYAKQCDP